jgi:organic hydroperoxide reductase OsmC/OhrA
MTRHTASLIWTLGEGEDFPRGRYSRRHELSFDGGLAIPASASPHVVGAWADPAAADPEEMFVAALSSCHMLWFLHVARDAGFVVIRYRDHAEGVMEAIAPGRQALTRVTLHPQAEWRGPAPDEAAIERMHRHAHEMCFIANSVKASVIIAPAAAQPGAGQPEG